MKSSPKPPPTRQPERDHATGTESCMAIPQNPGTSSSPADSPSVTSNRKSPELGPFLVAGCGSIGRRHVRNLVASGQTDIAVCDPNPERTTSLVAEVGLPLRRYADCDEALSRVKPAVVFVCTPPSLHVKQALAAVRAGAHAFIEKPLSNTLDGVEELRREASTRQRTCQVGYNLRFHAGVSKVKELLDAGAIGPVSYAQVVMGQLFCLLFL